MALFITCRKEWLDSIWAKEKISNLTKAASARRIKYYFFFSREELEMYKEVYESEPSCVVLLTNNGKSDEELVNRFRELPMPIILFSNHKYGEISNEISIVVSNAADYIASILNVFKKRGCRYPAVVGMISTGHQDAIRIERFKKLDYSKKELVFDTKTGKLTEALEKLFGSREPVDGIICSNDLQAACLIGVFNMIDPEWNKKLLLASCGGMTFAGLMTPSVTTVNSDMDSGSRQVLKIYRMLANDRDVYSVHVITRQGLVERESTATQKPEGIIFSQKDIPSPEAIKEVIRTYKKAEKIERILSEADMTDYRIISGLMNGETSTRIAESTYCSVGTIKYRIKKYKEVIGEEKTADLAAVFNEIIDYDKINSAVKLPH